MQLYIVIIAVVVAVLFLFRRIKKQLFQKHEDCNGCAMNKTTQNQSK